MIPIPNPAELQAMTDEGFADQLKLIADCMIDAAEAGYYRIFKNLETSQAWLFENAGFVVTPALGMPPASAYTAAIAYHISWDPEAIRQRQAEQSAATVVPNNHE